MARIARVICTGAPHHITQRGNRRQQTFIKDEDYLAYIELMTEWCRKHEVAIWAWCLMPNHVHLIAVPQNEDGLARAIGRRIAVTPGGSISGRSGGDIYGRSALRLFPWMICIYLQQCVMWK